MSRKSRTQHSSSTPGKAKGANCHRSQLKNQYCKDTRLYRTNPTLYEKACKEIDRLTK
jgi:hypothetical protein